MSSPALALALSSGGATLSGPTGIVAPSDGLVARRMVVLLQVAGRYAELVDPSNGPSGVRGDGDALGLGRHEAGCALTRREHGSLRCSCAFRTVGEFERLAARLRSEDRGLWSHLDGWWLSASTRTIWLCPRCGVCHQSEHRHPNRKSGRLSTVKCKRVVQWQRRSGARESSAREALERMASWWDASFEPVLPREPGLS